METKERLFLVGVILGVFKNVMLGFFQARGINHTFQLEVISDTFAVINSVVGLLAVEILGVSVRDEVGVVLCGLFLVFHTVFYPLK
ncbi:hypothetical protein FSU_2252 [Fibrobacter succinogenes subsp. succinogenes S85]|uniref:Uncharacterized protein n=1 Tax=Fibrobacter succinogenes (strain ATCC 19169 / S85) TaxID=59374 RepID=D9S422_FIBSS|nr:hypothetical protein FSU_2252 [Fibrobacter succinogenes subsp. succinogenes S85]